MTYKQLILLTYALTAGSLAIVLTANYTKALQLEFAQARRSIAAPQIIVQQAPTVPVVAVARAIARGHRLSSQDLVVQNWPKDAAPKGGFASVQAFLAAHEAPVAKIDLFEGEPLLTAKVLQAGDGSTLALLLPKDRRAVTIQINEVRGVGGFVQPKDHVDVILTEKREGQKDKQPSLTSKVLLQNVQILAVGQETQLEGGRPKVASSVTLAVTLDDAQKLALAMTVGYLSLALRSPEQKMETATVGISLDDLRDTASKAAGGSMRVVIHRASIQAGEAAPAPVVIVRNSQH